MLTSETKEYIDKLKIMPIDNIDRAVVEEGLKLFTTEIEDMVSWMNTPRDFEAMQYSLNKLLTRELFALTNSYLSESKQRHLVNIDSISSIKDKLNRLYTKFSVNAAKNELDEKVQTMQKQNREIHNQVALGLLQMETSLSDLRYFNLMKFDAIDEKTTSDEVNKMHEDMIRSASQNDISRYVGALIVYVLQVKEAISKSKELAYLANPDGSIDFRGLVNELAEVRTQIEIKLKQYNDSLSNANLNMEQLNDIANDIFKMQLKLDEAINPVSEVIKKNMLTEKTGTFLIDYVSYDQPKSVLDGIGDDIKPLGFHKSDMQEKTSKRASGLTKAYKKISSNVNKESEQISNDIKSENNPSKIKGR